MTTVDVYTAGVQLTALVNALELALDVRFSRHQRDDDEWYSAERDGVSVFVNDDTADGSEPDFAGLPLHVELVKLASGTEAGRDALARRIFESLKAADLRALLAFDGQRQLDEFAPAPAS